MTMQVTVRFFATLRDRAGVDSATLALPAPATIQALLDQLANQFTAIAPALASALIAVNQTYAFPEEFLHDGDEVALFPPVSGGSEPVWPEHFQITEANLDLDAIVANITRPETGAVAVFTGAVRGLTYSENAEEITEHLVYESYVSMAEKTLHQIALEIRQRFPKIQGIAIVQRIGVLQVGDTTVLVACSSGHRNDGIFEAARFGIDRLKEIVPVWKKEIRPDGENWVEGHYHPTPADVLPHAAQQEASTFTIGCSQCGENYPLSTSRYVCECGEPLQILAAPLFDPQLINAKLSSIWRYGPMLLPEGVSSVTLGEGWTPMVQMESEHPLLYAKLEGSNPSGSFKDRGASVLVSLLKSLAIESVHDDSSGNAAAALAAYSARANMQARLFVPAAASAVKLAQIALYGARLEPVPGPRSAATIASQEASKNGESFYASHIYHPFSILGYRTLAYELWEQLGRQAPDAVIVPLGHGSQLIGLAQGFTELKRAGLITNDPQLIGVQPEACAPLWASLNHVSNADELETLAEGIRILDPVRSKEVLAAVTASQGDIVTVSEAEISKGLRSLAMQGFYVEPTSAVVWPAYLKVKDRFRDDARIILSLTGSGLKTPTPQQFL